MLVSRQPSTVTCRNRDLSGLYRSRLAFQSAIILSCLMREFQNVKELIKSCLADSRYRVLVFSNHKALKLKPLNIYSTRKRAVSVRWFHRVRSVHPPNALRVIKRISLIVFYCSFRIYPFLPLPLARSFRNKMSLNHYHCTIRGMLANIRDNFV